MSVELTTLNLEDALEVLIDYRGKTPKKTTAGIPLVTAKIVKAGKILSTEEFIAEEDFDSWMVRGLPKSGDVVLTTEAPLGEVAQIRDLPVALAQRIVTLRGKKGLLLNDYLKYLLLSPQMQEKLHGRSSGSTVVGIRQSELRKIEIQLPSVNYQSKVASILKALDNQIDNLEFQNTTLESIAQTLFKSWFVNFDPVHAKAAGREPEGLSEGIAALFPSEFEESELGLIPKGWKSQKLKECCVKIANGATPKRNEPAYWSNGNIPWLKTGEFSDGFVFDSEEQITALGAQKSSVKLFPPNTVLIALYGATVGKLAILGRESTFNQAATGLTADDKFGQWLVYLWLKFRRDWIVGMASGGAQQNISKAIVEDTAVIRPSDDVLKVVNSILTPIFESMKLNSELARILSSLRDELLPRLISGKIRIEDAEGALADVMPSTEKQVA